MFGICGSFVEATVTLAELEVELCLECKLASETRSLGLLLEPLAELPTPTVTAEPWFEAECPMEPMVFILALLELVLDVPELVVLRIDVNVPDGLSVTEDLSPVGGGRGSLRLSQPCLRAALGVIRVVGSHSRQRRMKSRNIGSSQPFKAV